jgi:D-alanyl-D-alanine-carboxypeptidase/D-alanyl-D-alanine-endopeptidase
MSPGCVKIPAQTIHIVAFVAGEIFATSSKSLHGATMPRIIATVVFALLAVPALAQSCSAPAASFAAASFESEIRRILAERIDSERRGVGIVVGVITPEGRRVISHGGFAQGDPRHLDGATVFEIGSVGKVFTALLLADMVQRGEVALDDPIAKYLPPDVKVPQQAGRAITLIDLATHTSALPRMPTNFSPRDPANPYADYTVEQLHGFLSGHILTRDIGIHYAYSNLGYGLLGNILERRAGADYEILVKSRIAAPLGLNSTVMTLPASMRTKAAIGHNELLQPVPDWDDTTLAGAGSLRSSANDMLTFLAAHLAHAKSPLGSAMSAMLAVRRPTGTRDLDIALGWHVSRQQGREFVWHNGGTGGYSSFVGLCPQTGVGIVVLANSEIGVNDIAVHLVDPSRPLDKPRRDGKDLAADSNAFEGYVGRYRLAADSIVTVSREGSRLFLEAAGQPRVEAFAHNKESGVFKVADARIKFERDAWGRVTGLILHQPGRDLPAVRIE